MIEISLPYIYKLSASIQPLSKVEQGTSLLQAFYNSLWNAEIELNAFLNQSIYSYTLKALKAPGVDLLAAIRALTEVEEKEREVNFFEAYKLSNALTTFENVLTAEMNVNNAYWVTKKRGFDTSDLINRAEVCWSPELPSKVPESLYDIRQAGRCIAFELSTAAGFHTMRATELVFRHYWDAVTKSAPRPGLGNMGDYVVALEQQKKGDPKTVATMRQIKELHRNELMHPEAVLDMNMAIELWGIAQSAVTAMLREIPDPVILPALVDLIP